MTSSLRHDALGWINVNRGADLNLHWGRSGQRSSKSPVEKASESPAL
jgi:hypothetical protein